MVTGSTADHRQVDGPGVCVSSEFTKLATGVGAIGMCFAGGFALAMMVDTAVVAPVVAHPRGRQGASRRGV